MGKNMRGLFSVLAAAVFTACIAQKPVGVTFTESGKGVGIFSGQVDKTATTAPATVGSMVNSIGSAVTILEFTVKENGSKDGYPLQIRQLRFTNIGTADIADLRFVLEGPGSNNTISSASGSIVIFKDFGDIIVPDGDTVGRTYQVKVHVRSNIQGSMADNSTIILKTSPVTDFDVVETSSNFLASVSAFQNNSTAVDVVATTLQGKSTFNGLTAQINQDFTGSGSASVYATDANGRVDLNFTSRVDLALKPDNINCIGGAPPGNLSSTDGGLQKNAVQGIATWSDLKFDTANSIRIEATSTTGPVPSPPVSALCTGTITVTP